MQVIALGAATEPNRCLKRRNERSPKVAPLCSRIEIVLFLLHSLDDHRCLGGPPSEQSLLLFVKPHRDVIDEAAHRGSDRTLYVAHPAVVTVATYFPRLKVWSCPTLRWCSHGIPIFRRRLRVST